MAVEPTEDVTSTGTFRRSTAAIAFAMGYAYGGRRDYYKNFGWDPDPSAKDYYAAFLRNPFANAVVSIPAQTAWRDPPTINDRADSESDQETPFERDVENFVRATRLWHYAQRAHLLARIGQFGVLMIGWADGDDQQFSNPVDQGTLQSNSVDSAVRWLRPFSQVSVKDIEYDDSPQRFGKPKRYKIDFGDENQAATDDDYLDGKTERWVHHDRVLHIAEGLLDDEVRGTPAQQPVYNILTDLQKTLGSAPEVAYSIARPLFHANIDPEASVSPEDEQAIDNELTSVIDELQPLARTQGVNLERIEGEAVDPGPVQDALIEALSAQTTIPQKKLKGNETGEVAGAKDLQEFYGRIREIRVQTLGPQIAREMVIRLQRFGVIAPPSGGGFDVEWDPLAEKDEQEHAEVKLARSKAAKNLATAVPGYSGEDWVEFVESGDFPEVSPPEIAPMDVEQERQRIEDGGQQPPALADGGDNGAGGDE